MPLTLAMGWSDLKSVLNTTNTQINVPLLVFSTADLKTPWICATL